jgi:hypothetical protein
VAVAPQSDLAAKDATFCRSDASLGLPYMSLPTQWLLSPCPGSRAGDSVAFGSRHGSNHPLPQAQEPTPRRCSFRVFEEHTRTGPFKPATTKKTKVKR